MSLIPGLCNDATRYIFSYLTDISDILRAERVNKSWQLAVAGEIRILQRRTKGRYIRDIIDWTTLKGFPKLQIVRYKLSCCHTDIEDLPDSLKEVHLVNSTNIHSDLERIQRKYPDPDVSWSLTSVYDCQWLHYTKDYLEIKCDERDPILSTKLAVEAKNLRIPLNHHPCRLNSAEELGFICPVVPTGKSLVALMGGWATLNPDLRRVYFVKRELWAGVIPSLPRVLAERVIDRPFSFDIPVNKKTLKHVRKAFTSLKSIAVREKHVSNGMVMSMRSEGLNVSVIPE